MLNDDWVNLHKSKMWHYFPFMDGYITCFKNRQSVYSLFIYPFTNKEPEALRAIKRYLLGVITNEKV